MAGVFRRPEKLSIAGGWAVHWYGRLKSGKKTELWVVESEGPVRSFRRLCMSESAAFGDQGMREHSYKHRRR